MPLVVSTFAVPGYRQVGWYESMLRLFSIRLLSQSCTSCSIHPRAIELRRGAAACLDRLPVLVSSAIRDAAG
jgi:hypothetical protein